MKQLIKYSSLIVVFLASCKKEEIKIYKDDPAVYFTAPTYSYSFTQDIDSSAKTIYLAVKLSGNKSDHDRSFNIQIVNDSNTNVPATLYEIKQGKVPGNSFDGKVAIVLKRNATVDSSIVKMRVQLVGSNELDPMLSPIVDITWTGKIIQPSNWKWLKYYFGTPFSTGWYKFMIQAAGVSSFPYDPTQAAADPVTWWWNANQIQAYGLKVKEALINYNAAHPGNELKHDDGAYAGQLVTMPI
ncbi:DUF4843 domain-containing protein [Pinibacter soli]|uniref:DUF4843 domain-containing protein n=1 Tax=Pinibacter soli TaxID=3044211 RepID=A0ABT6RFU8_9BACT|nr:DUF4843 domain-containing protein [Pinibacter soli]MDI3321446.1 DUF4843 domain-containing protein [Pinibacter soli]